MRFSVSELLNFYRCQRLLFLNKYGDKKFQLAPSDFLKRLWKFGRTYESNVVDFFKYEKPKYKVGDYEKGFEETLKLMKAGVETIYQGVLRNDELRGIPDFLIKAKGHSLFGDYYYYPVDVKGASTSRERYLFQLASYSYLLGEIQGFTPLYGGLLLLDMDLQIRHFCHLMKEVVYGISESKKILSDSENMPDLFIDSNCQMCQWYDFCLPEALKRQHLSLVYGVNKKIKDKLETISIKNYAELANCTEEDFSEIEELSGKKGESVIIQSICLKEKKIYLKSIPNIEKEEKEIFIDFESDMVLNEKGTELIRIDYLIGLLKCSDGKKDYLPLLLETDEQLSSDFTRFLNDHKDYIFYHYGHYEQSIFEDKWVDLPKVNLVNIEKIIKDSMVLPVSGYSLKNIAKIFGFRWSNKDANAMQSMCWYSNYLETKDKKYLDMSIEYNQDDCLALHFIKEWLLNLKKQKVPTGEFVSIKEILLSFFP